VQVSGPTVTHSYSQRAPARSYCAIRSRALASTAAFRSARTATKHPSGHPGVTTAQYLVFNEFEQRFSTSTKVDCYLETPLSDIDTRPGPEGDPFSIFNVGVQGTLTGMSRLRSVAGPNVDGYDGRAILALIGENWGAGVCGANPGTAGGSIPIADVQLCSTDADCDGGTCTNPFVATDAANVQFQGSRPQGDRISIPLP